jgi:hypothetical protein
LTPDKSTENDEAYMHGVAFGLSNMGTTVCVEPDLETQCAFVCGWVDGRSYTKWQLAELKEKTW